DSQGLAYRFSVVNAGRPGKESVAEVVSSLTGESAIAVARPCGGRQRHGNGATFREGGSAVSTVRGAEDPLRRDLRHQEQLDVHGREEDGGGGVAARVHLAALEAAHHRQAPRFAGAL